MSTPKIYLYPSYAQATRLTGVDVGDFWPEWPARLSEYGQEAEARAWQVEGYYRAASIHTARAAFFEYRSR